MDHAGAGGSAGQTLAEIARRQRSEVMPYLAHDARAERLAERRMQCAEKAWRCDKDELLETTFVVSDFERLAEQVREARRDLVAE